MTNGSGTMGASAKLMLALQFGLLRIEGTGFTGGLLGAKARAGAPLSLRVLLGCHFGRKTSVPVPVPFWGFGSS